MIIRDMTPEECRRALAEAGVARLACESGGQPYVVPVYLAYDGEALYGFSTLGRKVEHMRANPLVCVEIDEVKSQSQWLSVIVFGRYEELPDTPDHEATRQHAHELLQKRAMWWQPAYVAGTHGDPANPLIPVFFRIHIARMTGHTPDSIEPEAAPPTRARRRRRRLLDGVLGK